jgi:hypothetical protein
MGAWIGQKIYGPIAQKILNAGTPVVVRVEGALRMLAVFSLPAGVRADGFTRSSGYGGGALRARAEARFRPRV